MTFLLLLRILSLHNGDATATHVAIRRHTLQDRAICELCALMRNIYAGKSADNCARVWTGMFSSAAARFYRTLFANLIGSTKKTNKQNYLQFTMSVFR